MKKAILYIHGKGGNAAEADRYQALCPAADVYGLDYQGDTPWDTAGEITAKYDALASHYDSVVIIANSIGAYFAMHALQEKKIEKALLISPIVDMEKLIVDMMLWAKVSEPQLRENGEIETAFGETLSWNYLQYVRCHPIVWNVPTEILFAEKDNLTSRETIDAFCKKSNGGLTIMKDGEHWFHTDEQLAFLEQWIKGVL